MSLKFITPDGSYNAKTFSKRTMRGDLMRAMKFLLVVVGLLIIIGEDGVGIICRFKIQTREFN